MNNKSNFLFVSASRNTDFYCERLLKNYNSEKYEITTNFIQNNKDSLPTVYNKVLSDVRENNTYDYIVFLHNDVIINNLEMFLSSVCKDYHDNGSGLIGCAGATSLPLFNKVERKSWFTCSDKNSQAGYIKHIVNSQVNTSIFGNRKEAFPAMAIDGLCIIFTKKAIENKTLKFDEEFDFDFYDFDISLQVYTQKLFPISIVDVGSLIHFSIGEGILKPEYLIKQNKFLEKWKTQLSLIVPQ